MRNTPLTALFLALLASSLASKPKAYVFNGEHAAVSFGIKHWHIINVTGHFLTFRGTIRYDEKRVERSSVEASIDTASIYTRNSLRDDHLRNADFFDAPNHPKITFKSTRVRAGREQGSLDVEGDLTIRGVTRPVVLVARITGKLVADETGKERLGFEARTRINRRDYGVAWNKANKAGTLMVGDDVEIAISGATVKK